MAGLKVAIPLAIAIVLAGLFISAGLTMPEETTTVTDAQAQTTTVVQTRLHLSTTTVLETTTAEDTQTQVATATSLPQTSTVTETLLPRTGPVTVVVQVSCTGCVVGPLSKFEYTGTATNGTSNNQGSVTIQGDGNSTYLFTASPSQIKSGWSVEWNVQSTGNKGALEVKAFFNGDLASDKSSSAPPYAISGSVAINVY
jgi:hypothetical protein